MFGTTLFGRHRLNLCKDYCVIESSGNMFYKLNRMWDVIENHKVANLHVLLFLMIYVVTIATKSLLAVVASSPMI